MLLKSDGRWTIMIKTCSSYDKNAYKLLTQQDDMDKKISRINT